MFVEKDKEKAGKMVYKFQSSYQMYLSSSSQLQKKTSLDKIPLGQ